MANLRPVGDTLRLAMASLRALWLVGLLGVGCKARPQPAGAVERLVPLSATPTDAGNVAAQRAAAAARRTPIHPITDRPAPTGGLGARFGMTRAEVTALHPAGDCRGSGRYAFCNHALVAVPVQGVVTYEFCNDHVCGIAIDGSRTRDEAQMGREYDSFLAMLRRDLGAPSTEAKRAGPGCSGHLSLCLASHQADYSAKWSWEGGTQVVLSVDQLEDDALMAQAAVTWLNPEGVAAQTEDSTPVPVTRDGGAAPDAGATVAP